MARAIVDPAELRRFAHDLKRAGGEMQQQMAQLQARLGRLGETWKDQEHAKFAEEFEQTLKVLARFKTAADRHVPFLLRKAERIEEYLQQR